MLSLSVRSSYAWFLIWVPAIEYCTVYAWPLAHRILKILLNQIWLHYIVCVIVWRCICLICCNCSIYSMWAICYWLYVWYLLFWRHRLYWLYMCWLNLVFVWWMVTYIILAFLFSFNLRFDRLYYIIMSLETRIRQYICDPFKVYIDTRHNKF